MIDFGTSQSPKSTRPLTTYLCPSRPGHQALRNNFASSLLLRTWLPMTGRRVRRPTLFSLWRKARRENSAASRLLGSTSLRFALHGWQRTPRPIAASPVTCRPWQIRDTIRWSPFKWPFRDSSMLIGVSSYPTFTFSTVCAGIAGLAYDGEYMWVSCQGANAVRLVRVRDFQSFAFQDVSVPGPGAIAFDGKNMWVSSSDGSVRVIEAATGQEKYKVAGSPGNRVLEMAFDGTSIWATTGAAAVAVLPASNPNGGGSFFYLSEAGAWALAFDGTNMWITNEAHDTVTVAGPGLVNLGE
ncbi:YncE family protein, partial [Thiolapillus sp.]|uniref:YncE family protein n=3 Tax=Thiolapillus sp. TaxID=2017437 RepID=UPI003AF55265